MLDDDNLVYIFSKPVNELLMLMLIKLKNVLCFSVSDLINDRGANIFPNSINKMELTYIKTLMLLKFHASITAFLKMISIFILEFLL